MSKPLVIDLAKAQNPNQAGGKSAGLARMIQAGFSVPPGFVVTTEAFQDMTPVLKKTILKQFDDQKLDLVAVRSSAVNEDGTDAAWAGQLDTFLNTGREQLLANIQKCWDSTTSARAQAYASQHGVAVGPVGVVVQRMIQSEVSGVGFSVHPITKNDQQMIIEAGLGLGEAIVSGQITPDTYVVSKQPHNLLSKHLARQSKMLIRDASGQTKWHNLEAAQAQKLSDAQIAKLSKILVRLESHFGYPVDVEWALQGGELYLLQCRPITTL